MTGTIPMKLTPEQERRRRTKNYVVGALLLAFVVLFYFLTMVRMSANVPT